MAKSGLNTTGSDFGSDRFKRIEAPKTAMVVGKSVSQYGAGEVWHSLDVRNSMQLTMLNSTRIGQYDLSEYTTLIFPEGSYKAMDSKDWQAMSTQIRNGATAIAIGSSCGLVQSKLDSFETKAKKQAGDEPAKEPSDIQLPFDSAAKTNALKLISGAIFQTRIDRTHPLFFGFQSDRLPVFRSHAKFLKPSSNPYCNPGIYDSKRPHLAGYCSDENLEQLKQSASVVVVQMGKGRLIQISDNPNFRAFWHGTSRLFLNAVFFGDFVDPPSLKNE